MTTLTPEVIPGSGTAPPVTMFVRGKDRRPAFHGIWFGRWIESSGTIPTGKVNLEIGSGPANAGQRVEVTIEPGRDNRPQIRLIPARSVRWRLSLAPGVTPAPNGYRFELQRDGDDTPTTIYTRSLVSRTRALVAGAYVLTLIGQEEREGEARFTITSTAVSHEVREIPITIGPR